MRVDCVCAFHCMDYVVVFKPRIGEGQVLSTLLQADKTQEATRAFSIAATILLQLPDIPLPLTFAKDMDIVKVWFLILAKINGINGSLLSLIMCSLKTITGPWHRLKPNTLLWTFSF